MSGLAAGIEQSKYKVIDAMKGLTTDMKLNTTISGGGGMAAAKPTIIFQNHGTIIGSNGMKEFAKIVSKEISKEYGFKTGGTW